MMQKGRDVIQVMADGYCRAKDTNNEIKKEYVHIRFDAQILVYYQASFSLVHRFQGLEYNDFMGWLYDAIEYACKYRAWQDPSKHTNAQQAINQCIETIRLRDIMISIFKRIRQIKTLCLLMQSLMQMVLLLFLIL